MIVHGSALPPSKRGLHSCRVGLRNDKVRYRQLPLRGIDIKQGETAVSACGIRRLRTSPEPHAEFIAVALTVVRHLVPLGHILELYGTVHNIERLVAC